MSRPQSGVVRRHQFNGGLAPARAEALSESFRLTVDLASYPNGQIGRSWDIEGMPLKYPYQQSRFCVMFRRSEL